MGVLIRARADRNQTQARLGAGGVRPTHFAVKSDLRSLQRAVLRAAKTLGGAPRHFNMLFWTLFALSTVRAPPLAVECVTNIFLQPSLLFFT